MLPIGRSIWLVFVLVSLEAIFSIFSLNAELAIGRASMYSVGLSVAATCLILGIVWRYDDSIADSIELVAHFSGYLPRNVWLFLCICVGTASRILWAMAFPTPLRSDYATYFLLARNLAEHGVYQISNSGHAYWPPGYPLFLAANFLVFGVHDWVPTVANLFLFSAGLIIIYRLAVLVADEAAARYATVLLVVWPGDITSTGLASKERLLAVLLPLALLLFLLSSKRSVRMEHVGLCFVVGILLGVASLTQPSVLLFPVLLIIYALGFKDRKMWNASTVVSIFAAMALVIGPWTVRNFFVLKQWIPISTNGGDVFYRANNPLATGGYIPAGVQKLDQLDEVTRSKAGFQLGLEWISSNPFEFAKLVLRKQVLFLGDDGNGVFETLKRGLEISDWRYIVFKGLSNLFWLGIWITVLVASVLCVKRKLIENQSTALLILAFCYFLAVHSVFESGGRHHEQVTLCLMVLTATITQQRHVQEC